MLLCKLSINLTSNFWEVVRHRLAVDGFQLSHNRIPIVVLFHVLPTCPADALP
jgi:hypothetical protein